MCLLSPPQVLLWHMSRKKKGQMFQTAIDQRDGGARGKIKHHLWIFFLFFPTQCANSSPPPRVKINQTSSSFFLILSAKRPPGTALPSSITAVELGKRGRPEAPSTVVFVPRRNVQIRVKDSPRKSHQTGWDHVSRYLINVYRDVFLLFFFLLSWDGNQ